MSSTQNGFVLNELLIHAIFDLEIKMKNEIRQKTEQQIKEMEKEGEKMEKRMEEIESKLDILMGLNNNGGRENNNDIEGHSGRYGGRNNFGNEWIPRGKGHFGGPSKYQQNGFMPRNNGRPNNGHWEKQGQNGGERNWRKGEQNYGAKNGAMGPSNEGLVYRCPEGENGTAHFNNHKMVYRRNAGQNSMNLGNDEGGRNESQKKLGEEMLQSVSGKWISKIGEYYTTDEEEEDEEEEEEDGTGEEEESDIGEAEAEMDEFLVAKPAPGYFDEEGNRLKNILGGGEEKSDAENEDLEGEKKEEGKGVMDPLPIVHLCPAQIGSPVLIHSPQIQTAPHGTNNSSDIPPPPSADGGFGKGRRN